MQMFMIVGVATRRQLKKKSWKFIGLASFHWELLTLMTLGIDAFGTLDF